MGKGRGQLNKQQSGMVAIMVTIVLMFIISLMTLGFSQIVRREQRQALDDHLSTQAFYAAESGINLARQNITSFLTPPGKTNCTGSGLNYDIATGVKITCLLINPNPEDLQYNNLTALNSEVGLLETTAAMNEIIINWQKVANSTVEAGCNFTNNPRVSNWQGSCSQPLLRVDLVNLDGTRATDWSNNQFTTFLYPNPSGSTNPIAFSDASTSANRGKKFAIKCDSNLSGSTDPEKKSACKVKISGLGGRKYGFRLTSVYWNASVSLRANGGGTPLSFVNGQAIIDSTAVAQDVLHRIQVRVQLTGSQTNGLAPDFAIYSRNGLCKQYVFRTTTTTWNPPTPGYPTTTSTDVYTPQGDCKPGASGW